jgi:hypothetical protein
MSRSVGALLRKARRMDVWGALYPVGVALAVALFVAVILALCWWSIVLFTVGIWWAGALTGGAAVGVFIGGLVATA